MLKAILWDNDGVLVDTEGLYYRATRDALAEVGVDLTPELFMEISLRRGRSAFDLAARRGLSAQRIARLRVERDRRYSEILHRGVPPVDGIESTLAELHGRVTMAVVTSAQRRHFDLIHRSSGLLRFFDFVLTREDYEHTKPHPDPYLTALARAGLPADQCVVVEDSERGCLSATAAGIRVLAVPNHMTRTNDFSSAYKVLPSVRDVASELRSLLDGGCPREVT
jgi:HAD superfamily hydrolase (TIGR01509 family)